LYCILSLATLQNKTTIEDHVNNFQEEEFKMFVNNKMNNNIYNTVGTVLKYNRIKLLGRMNNVLKE
jgi:methionyl-tRNA synthetase